MSTAVISACGRYRYQLTRGVGRLLAFVQHNPSKADAEINDPTLTRDLGFAAREGYDGAELMNVYAGRETEPKKLRLFSDPFGPDNEKWLDSLAQRHDKIVCAWGAGVIPAHAAATVAILRRYGARLMCFGTTKGGQPKHPLYLAANTPLIDWDAA